MNPVFSEKETKLIADSIIDSVYTINTYGRPIRTITSTEDMVYNMKSKFALLNIYALTLEDAASVLGYIDSWMESLSVKKKRESSDTITALLKSAGHTPEVIKEIFKTDSLTNPFNY